MAFPSEEGWGGGVCVCVPAWVHLKKYGEWSTEKEEHILKTGLV